LPNTPRTRHQCLPPRIDIWRFRQEWENGVEHRHLGFGGSRHQPEPVRCYWPGRHGTELNHVLGRDMKHLSAAVQLDDGSHSNPVRGIGRICKPGQYAGVNESGH
jgi:hypothetical protein